MNLTEWVHRQGIRVTAACRWWREGTLPVPARKAGRLILVSPDTAAGLSGPDAVGLYARASSHDRRADLGRQMARLSSWAARAGLPVARAGAGSGVNETRVKACGLLAGPEVTVVVAGHRDRLGRMNTGLAGAALAAHGHRLVVVEDSEVTGDLVRDVTGVPASLRARLCGGRPAGTGC